jgi:DNA-binding PadR family transcriptional regulator
VTNRDARAKLRRTHTIRRIGDHLLVHPDGDEGRVIARLTGLNPKPVTAALRRLVAAGYATEVEQVDPADGKHPTRLYRLTDDGRAWAAQDSRLLVWRRTLHLESGRGPATVAIVYLPSPQTDPDTEDWRVEFTGDVEDLTAGDASNLALLIGMAAEQVAAARQPPASWLRRMRGQEPPDLGPEADQTTRLLRAARPLVAERAGKEPIPPHVG